MSEQIITKQCRTCKQIKPISEFGKDRTKKDGYSHCCKMCRVNYQRKYSRTDKGKEVSRRARSKHQQTEKGKATQRRYIQSEKGKITKQKAAKRYAQSKKGKKYYVQNAYRFRKKHPEQYRAGRVLNNAIRKGKLPHPNSLQCHYCPAQAKDYHHHKGYAPEHWLDVIPVCRKCHNNLSV